MLRLRYAFTPFAELLRCYDILMPLLRFSSPADAAMPLDYCRAIFIYVIFACCRYVAAMPLHAYFRLRHTPRLLLRC